jgi:hypothetical protein
MICFSACYGLTPLQQKVFYTSCHPLVPQSSGKVGVLVTDKPPMGQTEKQEFSSENLHLFFPPY